MTLTDKDNNNQEFYSSDVTSNTSKKIMPEKLKMPVTNKHQEVGLAVKDVLLQAIEQNRATFGINEAGLLLETCPEEVMLCLLPESDAGDVTLHIHFTLIEAFCWENNIRLIKVDEAKKLKDIVSAMTVAQNNNNIEEQRMLEQLDFNCVLIEYPSEDFSTADENLIEYYKLTADVSPQPIIELPV